MLQLVRVAKTYGVKVIFKDVSCAFAPGSVSLLVGGNGAGKSTLMRVMAGLSRPSAGEARLAEHVRVGYLGHATFLYPGLTALENLAFWRDACGLAFSRKDLMAALEASIRAINKDTGEAGGRKTAPSGRKKARAH